ncbi:ARABIDOPSIS THALIANA ADENINE PHOSPHORIBOSYLTRANSFERASE 1, adenine phosphoribosyl transferase 1 [Hibiscus trionum]|uniref:adenine phosphoribosyltransferase n=1 Tax=Hibiscus trionum TaxID=183268 RepID=A0A9W7HSN8_HIBTR|nr:ARABIDOPSIS THALIANA ADENINE PHOSPHORIBOSYLTRANSFERASE 1, adenine phosphoribosyl transferase 1 [Hibiscus trionum]
MQRALIFSSSNPIYSQLSTTIAPPDSAVFPKRDGGWIGPFSSNQPPVFRLRNYKRTLLPPLCSASDSVANQPTMASQDEQDPRISKISSAIRVIPNFPKPGIMFQDITTLLLDTKAFRDTIDLFVERYRGKDISVVAGIEARGFIFGPPIALAIGAKFVPMRKPNKLPGEVISEEYSLEYGTDKMEMHVGAVQAGERALVIDDLIATGGTLCAAIRLLERVGVHVVECACVIELPELKGRDRLGDKPLFVLVSST